MLERELEQPVVSVTQQAMSSSARAAFSVGMGIDEPRRVGAR